MEHPTPLADGLANAVTRRSPTIRVIIYGIHGPVWTRALAADASVWRKMPAVVEVLTVPAKPEFPLPDPAGGDPVTVIVPLMEAHARQCPRHYASLIPAARSLATLGDKAAFAAYMTSHGFDGLCPRSYSDASDAVFPCVVKRVDLNVGKGIAVARSADELAALLGQEPWAGHPVILQALIAGTTDRVMHCICRNGRVLWHCTFAHEMESADFIRGNRRGIVSTRSVTEPPSIIAQVERILTPLAYDGPCNIDYKVADDGTIAVFEINPRLGGSLMWPQHVEQLEGALSHIIAAALERGSMAA